MPTSNFQRFSDRYFWMSPLFSSSGWYFKAREGQILGPFISRAEAEQAVSHFIDECHNRGDLGGR